MKNFSKPIFLLTLIGFALFISSCSKDKDDSPLPTAVNLYFTYWDGNSVNKIDLINTPNAVTVLFDNTDGLAEPCGIALTDDGYLIVSEENGNRILKMRKNGSGEVAVLYDISDGVNEPTAVTIDNATGTLYWCNSGSNQVMKGSEDGLTTPTAMYGGNAVISSAYGIAIDKKNKKLYTCDFTQYIKAGNLDGTGTTESLWDKTKFTEMSNPSNIFVDPDHGNIYWADEGSDQIVSANLDGTGTPEVLFDNSDGVNRADGVYVDYNSKKIYWSETNNNVIARGNLSGTGEREILVENVESYGLTLEIQ